MEIKYVKGVNYDYSSKPNKNKKYEVGEIYEGENGVIYFCPVEHINAIMGYFENPKQTRFLVIEPLEDVYCDAAMPDYCSSRKIKVVRELTIEEVMNLDQTGIIRSRFESHIFK